MADNEDYTGLTKEEIAILNTSDDDAAIDEVAAPVVEEEATDDGNDNPGVSGSDTDAGETDEDDKPADKAGDDGSKGVAEADDKPGEGGDQGQTGELAPEVEDDESTVDDFVPGVAAKLPTLSKTELDGLDKQLKALDDEFDEGEMPSRVYVARREEIKSKINEHSLAVKLNAANVDANWRAAQGFFFKTNPVFKSNSMLAGAFQSKVNALISDPSSNSMSDMEILTKCRKDLIADLKKDGIVIPGLAGDKAATDKKASEKSKAKAINDAKKAKAGKKGEDLSDVPTEAQIGGGTWMGRLDKLALTNGQKFEEEFGKLSQREQDEYMAKR